METERIAPHETFELHELLTFKTVCATKSDAMSKIVKDEKLRVILEEDFSLGKDHIRELQSLLKRSGSFRDETEDIQGFEETSDTGRDDTLRQ